MYKYNWKDYIMRIKDTQQPKRHENISEGEWTTKKLLEQPILKRLNRPTKFKL
jgi:hypothetical protein